jgi:hypothetical protein
MELRHAVDLEDDERARPVVALGALDLVLELLAEGLDPQEAGERVATAPEELLLELADATASDLELAGELVAIFASGHLV